MLICRSVQYLAVLFLAIGLVGCGTRSISNSGYHADSDRPGYAQQNNPFYSGELNEFDVIGIDTKSAITEEQIANAAKAKSRFTIAKGSTIMLIQSGASMPDEDMSKGIEKYYNVTAFTGVPTRNGVTDSAYSRALRLAAAQAGADKLLVYWGFLETGREDLATKAISWLPFVGDAISDEKQRMRIRMKVAVVDVKSGQWETFLPEPFDNAALSGGYTRESSDQAQVALLKSKAYQATAEDLVKRYAK